MKHSIDIDTPVIDFGAHLDPQGIEIDGPPSKPQAGPDRVHDPDTLLAELNEAGVDRAVLSQPLFVGHDDVDEARVVNDTLLEVIENYEAFYGLASVPTAAGGDVAAAEFERCLDDGYHGGALQTESEGINLVDAEVEPIFEVAVDRGAPLFVHVPSLPSKPYRASAIFGREHAMAENISAVIHSGVLDSYPDLNLVYHHLGGNIASMLGRIHLHTLPERWDDQTGMKSFGEFKAQLEERIYVDTSGFFGYHAPIEATLEEFPASQILFGTDIPWEPRDATETRHFVESIANECTLEERRKILGGNALDLLVNV